MRKTIYIFLLILLGIYNFFFWSEKFGVNLFIFLSLCSAAVMWLNGENVKNRNVIISLLAFLYSASMVIVVNSEFSKFAAIVTFGLFIGYTHQRQLKTVFNAFLTTLSSLIIFPYHIIEELRLSSGKYKSVRSFFRIVKLAFIPVVLFVIFYSIYAYSNPVFNSYSAAFWKTIGDYLYEVFKDYPILRFFYLLLGLIIIMGVLFNRNIKAFAQIDGKFLDFLSRDKINKTYSVVNPSRKQPLLYQAVNYRFKMNSLKLEYKMGLLFIIMINLLLLFLNIIDIQFTWLGFNTSEVDNLAYYVHNGTYLLIFSIVLSMAILLYFFRSNQNFYQNNKLLKYGAYLWIIQNVFMALSVGLRNLYYIDFYYALSYKRIGVMIYLLLVFIGLVTMFIKINRKKTTYWLLKTNSGALIIVLLLMSSFSWDKTIAEFNLSNPNKDAVDIEYLLRLSDDTLPILDKHKETLDREYMQYSFIMSDYYNGLEEYKHKVYVFHSDQNNYSWLSWNLPDYNIKQYYSENGMPYKYKSTGNYLQDNKNKTRIDIPTPEINAVPNNNDLNPQGDSLLPKIELKQK